MTPLPTTADVVASDQQRTSTDAVCSLPFAFECNEENCCESYHSRFIILLVVFGITLLAALVLAIWLIFEFRPAYRNRLNSAEIIDDDELQRKNYEEAKHLRRMSEMKFPHGRPL